MFQERIDIMKQNILQYLEECKKRFPNKTAFEDIKEKCTYSELISDAEVIGSFIAKKTGLRTPIPIFMDKSVKAIKCFMGAVYAGCFYVMLDPRQPAARLKHILNVLEAKIIVADKEYEEEIASLEFEGEVFYYTEVIQGQRDSDVLKGIRSQVYDVDPLYSIFTSGSTGIPKGVVVSHRSVIDFIEHFTEIFDITDRDIIGNQAPFDFDVSVKDIYSTLKAGATMQILPKQYFSIPMKLLDRLCEKGVTTIIWAVSAMCIITTLKGFQYKIPYTLKKIMFSGEVMPIKHLNQWMDNIPDAMYVNLYGPTEITCNCTYHVVDRRYEQGEVLPIGKPFPNEKVFLLDEKEKLIDKQGGIGEICVSGTALSLGYYNNPEQTRKAFVQNPIHSKYMETIYRTGDLGFYNERGELCFASRKDFQIKHMGHRIELGEIELVMGKNERIDRVCCIYDEKKNKILAFYVGDIEKKEIVREISRELPGFMLPNVFIRIENMPITKNGKIDRKELMYQYQEGKR